MKSELVSRFIKVRRLTQVHADKKTSRKVTQAGSALSRIKSEKSAGQEPNQAPRIGTPVTAAVALESNPCNASPHRTPARGANRMPCLLQTSGLPPGSPLDWRAAFLGEWAPLWGQQSAPPGLPSALCGLIGLLMATAAAASAATAARGGGWARLPLFHKPESAANDPLDRLARLGILGQRGVHHALFHLESALFLPNRFVNVSWHGPKFKRHFKRWQAGLVVWRSALGGCQPPVVKPFCVEAVVPTAYPTPNAQRH